MRRVWMRRRGREAARILACLATAWLMAACASEAQDFGVTIESLETSRQAGHVQLVVHQDIRLSTEARAALEHGVPLVIQVEARLRRSRGGNDVMTIERHFEIRYLPLSDHYQVMEGDGQQQGTYPRLRHALADLREVTLPLPGTLAGTGPWEAGARSRLLASRLPRPMRLPAWFSARWRHDSGWRVEAVRWPEPT
ncbi:DUF4390 domain-containing protein [Elongatibacter sediminis]|uniref:DUF4390 domain-containing protein n=1 Tax=Elongatibacter sediminis TaxID=3119006 RepID=A0AAW9RJF0_9GAMM